jgi:hypothetical protein
LCRERKCLAGIRHRRDGDATDGVGHRFGERSARTDFGTTERAI